MEKLGANRFLTNLLAYGADSENDANDETDNDGRTESHEPPKPGDRRRTRNRNESRNDSDEDLDYDDDEDLSGGKFDHIRDRRDRRIARLSDENSKWRNNFRNAQKDNDRLEKENQKLVEKYEKLEAEAKTSAIRNAILSGETHFHDISMVMGLLNSDELAVDLRDGSIGGLDDQIISITESHPFLVKDKDGQGQGQKTSAQPSGIPPRSSASGEKSRGDTEKEQMQKMMADFPAMSSL